MDSGALFCVECGLQLPANARFCYQCGSPVPVQTVADPAPTDQRLNVTEPAWYPSKAQWWVIWITAGIVGVGLLSTGAGIALLAIVMWGGLLVWQLSRRGR